MSKKSVLFFIFLSLVAGAFAGLIWFRKTNNQIAVCKSLQPGIKEADLAAHFGAPYERKKTGELYFQSSWAAAGPIRAKVDAAGKIIMLKCSEDSPANWTV